MYKGKFVSDRQLASLMWNKEQPMCDYGAWHWLLSEAAFKAHSINYKGQVVNIKKGQLPFSYRKLAETFKWSIKRLQGFLKKRVKEGLLVITTDTPVSIITVCSYSKIQKIAKGGNTESDTLRATSMDTEGTTNRTKETKETKEIRGRGCISGNVKQSWKVRIRNILGDKKYSIWIEPCFLDGKYILCPSKSHKDWCTQNVKLDIERILGKGFLGFRVAEARSNFEFNQN